MQGSKFKLLIVIIVNALKHSKLRFPPQHADFANAARWFSTQHVISSNSARYIFNTARRLPKHSTLFSRFIHEKSPNSLGSQA